MPGSTLSTTTVVGALSSSVAQDSAADATALSLKAGAAEVHAVSINNADGAAKVFVELWNVLVGSVTVGTTAPNAWFPCGAAESSTYWLRDLVDNNGMSFDTALVYAVVTGVGGNTAPSDPKPIVTILFS